MAVQVSKLLDPTSLKAPAGFKILNLLVEDKTCSFNLNQQVVQVQYFDNIFKLNILTIINS